MAFYLSAAVYPEGNLEHEYPTAELEQSEDNHTMENRGAGNWALFEYMHVQRGLEVKSVFETRTGLPSSVSQFFHLFSLTSTNADLRDIGRQVPLVPYTPQYDTVEITGPGTIDDVTPRPWGMRRLLLLVEDDMYACISPDTGGSVEASWRPGSPGERGVNYIEVPEIPIDGDSTLVVTATGTGISPSLSTTSSRIQTIARRSRRTTAGVSLPTPVSRYVHRPCTTGIWRR